MLFVPFYGHSEIEEVLNSNVLSLNFRMRRN